jgi:16S rRNA (adenine(1408)-N(1))-methyltransferase
VLARARAEPDMLVLGIDANADGMAEAASRAARRPARGGAPNARFLVCAVEALPVELAAIADEVTVQFPWGSLLRGIVAGESAVLAPITRLLKPLPAAELRLLLSVEPRDRSLGVPVLDAHAAASIGAAAVELGLAPVEVRPAEAADLTASRSTWARKLRAGSGQRRAWLLTFRHRGLERRYPRATGQECRANRHAGGAIKEWGRCRKSRTPTSSGCGTSSSSKGQRSEGG